MTLIKWVRYLLIMKAYWVLPPSKRISDTRWEHAMLITEDLGKYSLTHSPRVPGLPIYKTTCCLQLKVGRGPLTFWEVSSPFPVSCSHPHPYSARTLPTGPPPHIALCSIRGRKKKPVRTENCNVVMTLLQMLCSHSRHKYEIWCSLHSTRKH